MKLAPIDYVVEGLEIPEMPGTVLGDVLLEISIDYMGEWYVDNLYMQEGTHEDIADVVKPLIRKHIHQNPYYGELIYEACAKAASDDRMGGRYEYQKMA